MLPPAHGAALASLFLLCGCATARRPQAAEETVVISRTPWGLFSPFTPDFDVTVKPDGQVLLRRRHRPTPGVDRFRVSGAGAARLRASLLPYRPSGDGLLPDPMADEEVVVCRVAIYELRWESFASSRTRTLCGQKFEPIEEALRAIGMTTDGDRR